MHCIPQVLRGMSLCSGICMSDESTCNRETQNEATAHPIIGRLTTHNHRATMVEAVSEVGSGLNGRGPKLLQLLANPEMQTIVVEHRDR